MESTMKIRSLSIHRGVDKLFSNLDLDFGPGRNPVAIMGPSGSGKSTLVYVLSRLENTLDSVKTLGEVYLDGKLLVGWDLWEYRKKVGVCLQTPVVFPGSIEHNALLGAKCKFNLPASKAKSLCQELLEQVGLWEEVKNDLKTKASELSVGQQQRLCLARTLGVDPKYLLLDEPTAALDAKSTHCIERILEELRSRMGVLIVTHQKLQAQRMKAQIFELDPDTKTFMAI